MNSETRGWFARCVQIVVTDAILLWYRQLPWRYASTSITLLLIYCHNLYVYDRSQKAVSPHATHSDSLKPYSMQKMISQITSAIPKTTATPSAPCKVRAFQRCRWRTQAWSLQKKAIYKQLYDAPNGINMDDRGTGKCKKECWTEGDSNPRGETPWECAVLCTEAYAWVTRHNHSAICPKLICLFDDENWNVYVYIYIHIQWAGVAMPLFSMPLKIKVGLWSLDFPCPTCVLRRAGVAYRDYKHKKHERNKQPFFLQQTFM